MNLAILGVILGGLIFTITIINYGLAIRSEISNLRLKALRDNLDIWKQMKTHAPNQGVHFDALLLLVCAVGMMNPISMLSSMPLFIVSVLRIKSMHLNFKLRPPQWNFKRCTPIQEYEAWALKYDPVHGIQWFLADRQNRFDAGFFGQRVIPELIAEIRILQKKAGLAVTDPMPQVSWLKK